MISASKSTLSLNNLKILRPKITQNLKKFCESPPCILCAIGSNRVKVHIENGVHQGPMKSDKYWNFCII